MANKHLEVEFKLWNSNHPDGFQPVLVGDHLELGKWNPSNGTRARFVKKGGCWSALTHLLPKTVYQWKWVLVDVSGANFIWEDCPNRKIELGLIGGRANSDWNSPGQFYPDECVLFAGTHYKTVEDSDALAMLGSSPALGEWNPKCSVVAVEYPLRSGWWVARAVLEKGSRQDWKWAVLDEHKNVKKWEDRVNRHFESADDMVELRTLWNADSIVEDEEPAVERLYNSYDKGIEANISVRSRQLWGY